MGRLANRIRLINGGVEVADPAVKLFFLVAGFEYSHKGLDFWKMCTGRVRERIAFINRTLSAKDPLLSGDSTLRFLRFDVTTGKIEVIDRSFFAGKGIKDKVVNESDWKPLSSIGTGDSFDPATFVSKGPFRAIDRAADYKNPTEEYPEFDQGPTKSDVMSIVDVYASVRGAPLLSVLELGLFSHGWIEGPILVNSSNKRNDPNLRDADDKDGRAALDFNLVMGVSDGSASALLNRVRFIGSFDPKGIVQTWGCNFDIELRVVQQTQKAMRAAKGAFTDDSVINFEFETWAPGRYLVTDPTSEFFPADPAQTKISRTFREAKKFLRRRLSESYAFNFANASGTQSGLGALPGTEGDDEKTGFHLMKICAKVDEPECPVGFAALFDFFKKNIGINVNDRGYGVYDQPTVQKLNADIAVDRTP